MGVVSGGAITCFQQLPSGLALGPALPWGAQGTGGRGKEGVWISRSWDGGRATSQGEGIRAPDSCQAGVGGFGRTHRQLGPGKVLPLLAPNGLGEVLPSGTSCHQATAGK